MHVDFLHFLFPTDFSLTSFEMYSSLLQLTSSKKGFGSFIFSKMPSLKKPFLRNYNVF